MLFDKVDHAHSQVNVLLLKQFIPQNFVYRFGSIKTVLIEEKILKDAASEVKLARVPRLNRRNPNNPQEFIATTNVKLAFHISGLPEHIVFGYTRVPVAYFVVKSRQSFKCRRLGYTSKLCKVNIEQCLSCGKKASA